MNKTKPRTEPPGWALKAAKEIAEELAREILAHSNTRNGCRFCNPKYPLDTYHLGTDKRPIPAEHEPRCPSHIARQYLKLVEEK